MPRPVTEDEALCYRGIQKVMIEAHCADDREQHRCAGRITIDRETITFNCPRCGDGRQLIPPAS